MFYIRLADLTVEIHHIYSFVKWFCREYRIDPVENPDIVVHTTKEEIEHVIQAEDASIPVDQAEGICIYREICLQLQKKYQGFLMHCALIEYEGWGYAFAAKSGTGKSTHIQQWQKKFGKENVRIINGDKPLLRFKDGHLMAYGTPWCGKEGYQTNASVPMKAICFIERSTKNTIHPIPPTEALTRIFHQILTPGDEEMVDALFPLIDRTIQEIPCYVLGCTISEEAAEVAYSGMNQK